MNGSFLFGLMVGMMLAAVVVLAISGTRSRESRMRDAENLVRERFNATLTELGLTGLFPANYDLATPLHVMKAAMDQVEDLERLLESGQAAAETDARRLASALEDRLRNGWPFDITTLHVLSAHKKRVGEKDGRPSPRLN